jgi:hypothetical protein
MAAADARLLPDLLNYPYTVQSMARNPYVSAQITATFASAPLGYINKIMKHPSRDGIIGELMEASGLDSAEYAVFNGDGYCRAFGATGISLIEEVAVLFADEGDPWGLTFNVIGLARLIDSVLVECLSSSGGDPTMAANRAITKDGDGSSAVSRMAKRIHMSNYRTTTPPSSIIDRGMISHFTARVVMKTGLALTSSPNVRLFNPGRMANGYGEGIEGSFEGMIVIPTRDQKFRMDILKVARFDGGATVTAVRGESGRSAVISMEFGVPTVPVIDSENLDVSHLMRSAHNQSEHLAPSGGKQRAVVNVVHRNQNNLYLRGKLLLSMELTGNTDIRGGLKGTYGDYTDEIFGPCYMSDTLNIEPFCYYATNRSVRMLEISGGFGFAAPSFTMLRVDHFFSRATTSVVGVTGQLIGHGTTAQAKTDVYDFVNPILVDFGGDMFSPESVASVMSHLANMTGSQHAIDLAPMPGVPFNAAYTHRDYPYAIPAAHRTSGSRAYRVAQLLDEVCPGSVYRDINSLNNALCQVLHEYIELKIFNSTASPTLMRIVILLMVWHRDMSGHPLRRGHRQLHGLEQTDLYEDFPKYLGYVVATNDYRAALNNGDSLNPVCPGSVRRGKMKHARETMPQAEAQEASDRAKRTLIEIEKLASASEALACACASLPLSGGDEGRLGNWRQARCCYYRQSTMDDLEQQVMSVGQRLSVARPRGKIVRLITATSAQHTNPKGFPRFKARVTQVIGSGQGALLALNEAYDIGINIVLLISVLQSVGIEPLL